MNSNIQELKRLSKYLLTDAADLEPETYLTMLDDFCSTLGNTPITDPELAILVLLIAVRAGINDSTRSVINNIQYNFIKEEGETGNLYSAFARRALNTLGQVKI